jgi:hypothetical protein
MRTCRVQKDHLPGPKGPGLHYRMSVGFQTSDIETQNLLPIAFLPEATLPR